MLHFAAFVGQHCGAEAQTPWTNFYASPNVLRKYSALELVV
jgi:hypothetical protein